MEKYVYITWDSLHERVVCVHSDPDMECDDCKNHINDYWLNIKKCKIQYPKQKIRDQKINNIINGNK